jgi:hypothetical protein
VKAWRNSTLDLQEVIWRGRAESGCADERHGWSPRLVPTPTLTALTATTPHQRAFRFQPAKLTSLWLAGWMQTLQHCNTAGVKRTDMLRVICSLHGCLPMTKQFQGPWLRLIIAASQSSATTPHHLLCRRRLSPRHLRGNQDKSSFCTGLLSLWSGLSKSICTHPLALLLHAAVETLSNHP